MRRVAIFLLLTFLTIHASDAQSVSSPCQNVSMGVVAYESITVSSSSIGFTVATYGTSIYALATLETNPIRYRVDGTAPTASEGILVPTGSTFEVCGASEMRDFRMIRTGSDATVKVHFYRPN